MITKNEEASIGACLASVDWADEIIVVDNGSTDRTADVAAAFAAALESSERMNYLAPRMASLAALATRNFTTRFAGILIASPVAGLRPMRAARFTSTYRWPLA